MLLRFYSEFEEETAERERKYRALQSEQWRAGFAYKFWHHYLLTGQLTIAIKNGDRKSDSRLLRRLRPLAEAVFDVDDFDANLLNQSLSKYGLYYVNHECDGTVLRFTIALKDP